VGHKVNPIGLRTGIIRTWQSRWYSDKEYTRLLAEDIRLRQQLKQRLRNASVSRVEIERSGGNQVSVTIHTAKPGIVIGKSGSAVEALRQDLKRQVGREVRLNIVEIGRPELDAELVARNIADSLQKRIAFRRAVKQAIQRTMRFGAKGIKVVVSGRLGGAEMSRREREVVGKVPLHTLRADIDYGTCEAHTTYGRIGVKVWIYKGDIIGKQKIRIRPSEERLVELEEGMDYEEPTYSYTDGEEEYVEPGEEAEPEIDETLFADFGFRETEEDE
jgi:small subunit ribosomal protein S3